MERIAADETKLWEKTRERTCDEALAMHSARLTAAVPEEAMPYLHTVQTPEELAELGAALRECMSRLEFARVLPRMRRMYGKDFYDKSGLPHPPQLRVAS